ncbi:putative DSB repair complex subunit Ku70 [Talaromyces proteolyticus]|uniref:ATP-dependent DNA helicase II subunit 1 n=1 Tax=Talaromyces proteolyticus TaxID=1131652 RepID=A0AAD4L1I8_9EURO|nr:putative DSB repair complex subunit Ku70 [Talaromyces proteolyticus]KAH8702416.1 putative DSB repair complex subunit Ku70 [Talaromyces proteolyticus]
MSDNYPPPEEDPYQEDDEIDDAGYKSVKDAVLFAIDISDSMLRLRPSASEKEPPESPAKAAIKCAYSLMQQRIISNPKDMMGILFFGTEASKFYNEDENSRGDLSYPNCYLFTDLDIPDAGDVKKLRALAEEDEEEDQILVPSKDRVSMANVLFCANQIFTSKASNFLSRRLFIVTDNDNPHGQDRIMRSAATVRAKDLYDLGVIIELFPISQPDHDFDRSKFYDDIIYRSSPNDLEASGLSPALTQARTSGGDGISLLNSLLSSVNSKSVPRRALFSNVPLEFGPNFKISVTGYLLFKKQEPARSCFVWLGGEKPEIAKGTTTQMAEDTARTVEKGEIRKAYKYGGEQVSFTIEEQQALRNFGDPVIKIIGFKPLSSLPIWASIKHPTFIYPSDEDYVGSTRVFSALHQKLLHDQKIGIVWFIPRKNAAPVLAAMLPGAEKTDENEVQVSPPGLWIIPLPFADDIRQNPETNLYVAPEPLIDRMRTVVQQLQLPKAQYDPRKYPNPSLQWHYRILQALALDEDLPEQPVDKTIPRYRQIDKRAGDYVIEWGDELDSQYRKMFSEQPKTSTLAKRAPKASDTLAEKEHPAKKVKTENGAQNTADDVLNHYHSGLLSKLTLPILKDFLSSKKLSTTGKKADLIERVEEYFDKKG